MKQFKDVDPGYLQVSIKLNKYNIILSKDIFLKIFLLLRQNIGLLKLFFIQFLFFKCLCLTSCFCSRSRGEMARLRNTGCGNLVAGVVV